MNSLSIALDIQQGEKETYLSTLLPTIVFLLECLKKKKERFLESEQLVYVSLVDAIIEGIRKRRDSKIMNRQLIVSSILIPKYKDGWTGGNMQLRRRLAGHLFQDRWKDQGRGFVFLPLWPPNCLGQMLAVRDFSQHLVSSSKTIRPNIPRGARCIMGHCEMMWSAVCSLAPHSQFVRGARPHLYMDEQKRLARERRQLSLTQAALGRLMPKGAFL